MPGERELVAMMASLMALNALAIDTMLPAFPAFIDSFGLIEQNSVQYIIASYLLGMGGASIIYGPLSDRYGRKAVIVPSIIAYTILSFLCSYAPNFEILLALRFAQGCCGAAMGVLVAAIIRDRYEGDAMARRMSLIMMTFMMVPLVAPLIGSQILKVAPWRVIFDMFAILGIIVTIWVIRRLPETLDPENAIEIKGARIISIWRDILTNRSSLGYVFAAGVTMGSLFGFVHSAEAIFRVTFDAQEFFPYGFAVIVAGLAFANFTNARIVERFGARRVSQTALLLFILIGGLQLLTSQILPTSLPLFLVLLSVNMALVGFVVSNFSSIAMQPFAGMVGAAASFQNTVRTVTSAIIGATIGQMFNGSVFPMVLGFFLCGTVSMLFVLFSERGKLFTRPRNTPKDPLPKHTL